MLLAGVTAKWYRETVTDALLTCSGIFSLIS